MNNELIKQKLGCSWHQAKELDNNFHGPLVALDSERDSLKFASYYIDTKVFAKLWQWQFGDVHVVQGFVPTHIHYWKPMKDCDFSNLNWRSPKEHPKNNEEIIAWINYSRWDSSLTNNRLLNNSREPLRYLGSRLHFGYFHKGFWGCKIKAGIELYMNIPWNDVFKWTTTNDFAEKNDDPRKYPIDPADTYDANWILKLK